MTVYSDSELTIVYTGGMTFEVYRTDTHERVDTFDDSAVLIESTPEGCAEYYMKSYYGLEDVQELYND